MCSNKYRILLPVKKEVPDLKIRTKCLLACVSPDLALVSWWMYIVGVCNLINLFEQASSLEENMSVDAFEDHCKQYNYRGSAGAIMPSIVMFVICMAYTLF